MSTPDDNADVCSINKVKNRKKKPVMKNSEDNNTGNSDEDNEDGDDTPSDQNGKVVKKTSKGGSLNWSAIIIMILFGLPTTIAIAIQVYDFFYPKEAARRSVVERVRKCYDAAKPNEVVDILKIVKKYEGKEHVLFSVLRNKYRKFSACQ